MAVSMTNERYELIFGEYSITHAAIAGRNRIAFILKSDDNDEGRLDYDEVRTKMVLYNPDAWQNKGGLASVFIDQGVYLAWVAFSANDANSATVIIDRSAETFEFPNDSRWLSKEMDWQRLTDFGKTRMSSSIRGIKNIGNSIYAPGRFRKLLKRTGQGQWQDLTDEKEHPNLHEDLSKRIETTGKLRGANMGFMDVDGFSETDIYATGSKADLWHYDGKQWRRMGPPTNFSTECILCAPDGYVYVAGGIGHIMKGRYDASTGKEQWKLLKTEIYRTETWVHSMAWFGGKIYLGSDWALYCLEQNETLYKYQFPEGGVHQYSFQNVAATEDLLLSYGPSQAVVYDGEKWEQIVGAIAIPEPSDDHFDIRSHLG